LDGVVELFEEGEGDGGDFEETLVGPNDESIIELFSNAECRQIPWLSTSKSQSRTRSEENATYISVVIYVFWISSRGDGRIRSETIVDAIY
jgi:hypothetical protein